MTVTRRVEITRAYLGASALAGAALVWFALAGIHPVFGLVLASVATLAVLWWWRGVFSRNRVVLWLEERVPTLRYSLAALVDVPDTRFRETLESRVHDARFGRALALAGLKLVGLPLAFLVATHFVARPVIASVARSAAARGGGDRSLGADPTTHFVATVTPPAYTGITPTAVNDPTAVAALVGSSIRFTGAWSAQTTMPARPAVFRLQGPPARGQRMVALEPRADSAPRVVLELPGRDTVLPKANGAIGLSATARDDIGIVAGWFEIIISAGNSESFKFRSGVLGRAAAKGRDLRLESRLDLDSLKLQPGDIVHLRAVARDANPAPGTDVGSSETRTLRVFRVGESDSVSIETLPPPEVGRSELSQRMLIIMTEKLVKQTRTLARDAFSRESQNISREQSRLRKRVGQIIFTRLTGEERADDEANAAMADTVSPGEALLRAAEAATGADAEHPLEDEEGGPVIGVNRPLLEAFNAMWEAERRLGISEPKAALPHMLAALAAIQKARAAERLYLRGRAPRIVLDLERIRLTGKREGIDPVARGPGANDLAPMLARRARFSAALELLSRDPAAAIDSLVLVRVDLLADQPRAAATLDAAIGDLRSGRDATASLRVASRALAGDPVSSRATGWSGAW